MNYPRIILILLCIVAAGLYARVLLPPQPATQHSTPQPAQAQVQEQPKQKLKPLPAEQMNLVIEALAPEMKAQER